MRLCLNPPLKVVPGTFMEAAKIKDSLFLLGG